MIIGTIFSIMPAFVYWLAGTLAANGNPNAPTAGDDRRLHDAPEPAVLPARPAAQRPGRDPGLARAVRPDLRVPRDGPRDRRRARRGRAGPRHDARQGPLPRRLVPVPDRGGALAAAPTTRSRAADDDDRLDEPDVGARCRARVRRDGRDRRRRRPRRGPAADADDARRRAPCRRSASSTSTSPPSPASSSRSSARPARARPPRPTSSRGCTTSTRARSRSTTSTSAGSSSRRSARSSAS